VELAVPSKKASVATDHEQAVEEPPARTVALRMAEEADDSELGTQPTEPAHPGIGLLADPLRSEQRREAIAGNDELAGQDPVGAESGCGARAGLDQRPVGR
jgi:hypothetical protein